jgi:hypothetical protein
MIEEARFDFRWDVVGARLDERARRLFANGRGAGRGSQRSCDGLKITGLARSTIDRGKKRSR